MDKEYASSKAKVILSQLKVTVDPNVLFSWGISEKGFAVFPMPDGVEEIPSAALVMKVSGFQYKGYVLVVLDEGSDYYRVYTIRKGEYKEEGRDIGAEELGAFLDRLIERGDLSDEEYKAKSMQFFKDTFLG